jgi:hypothetical protein
MRFTPKARAGLGCLVAVAIIAPLLIGQGCPSLSSLSAGNTDTNTGANANTNTDTGKTVAAGTVSATAPALNATITAGQPVTIIYTVARTGAAVSAFYDVDGVRASGDEVVFQTGLQTGQDRFVQLSTAGLTSGTIHVGIISEDASGKVYAYAPGTVTIRESLTVTVASPLTDLVVNPGGLCTLRFTTTATTTFSYTVFYDQDGAFNGNEATIVSGAGSGTNFVSATWNTAGVSPGTYFVGVKVNEASSGNREGVAYASGRVSVVVGSYLSVIAPSVDLTAAPGTPIDITLASGVPGNTSAVVDVYFDADQTFSGSETPIQTGLTLGQTSLVWDTYTVQPGTYYVCAVLRLTPGAAPSLVAYSTGRIKLEGTVTGGTSQSLVIFTPSVDTTLFRGDTVQIRWATGASSVDTTLTLSYDFDTDNNNQPDGSPQEIKAGLNPSARVYEWDTRVNGSFVTGRFFLLAQLVNKNTGQAQPFVKSPARLTVRTPYFWLGDVDKGLISGAVLRGFNFQDHAGSGFSSVKDVDGDGMNDFIVLSQYGKPGLVNPGGLGEGEGYLIFGNHVRLTGVHDLNQTGSKPGVPPSVDPNPPVTSTTGLDQGVIFTGITLQPGSTINAGLVAAASTPDMDGDELDELMFAIPKTDSLSLKDQPSRLMDEGMLENSGHFLRGGIVLVSSRNDILSQRWSLSRDGTRVIRLQEVGQVFDNHRCPGATCNSDITCGGNYPCLNQRFVDVDKDGKCDDYDYVGWASFMLPEDGINPSLADPVFFCPMNHFAHSTGMLHDENVDWQPFGARILGQALEDGTTPDARFGTSISAIRSAGTGPSFMLISAPRQTAKKSDIPELPSDRANCGVAYELLTSNYWNPNDLGPEMIARPHQYIIKTRGFYTSIFQTGHGEIGTPWDVLARPIAIVGPAANVQISPITAIPDFNSDGIMDVVVGSPTQKVDAATGVVSVGDEGAVYIVFRRLLEGDGNYLLEKMALDPADPERLTGVMIRGEPGWNLGESFTGGGDFNGDGIQDVVIGIPNYNNTQGAALIVFGSQSLVSPKGGFHVADMVANGDAVLLVGGVIGDRAGFNASSIGDFDGDGKDDLAISAPGASPQFTDGGGQVHNGLDINGDGFSDDLNNDGAPDDLTSAGVVYVIYGSNSLLGQLSLNEIGTSELKGFALVGRSAFDQLGGGMDTIGLGCRSHGLAAAGDVDGDNLGDLLIGSMLADPSGKTNGGEAYLIYGGFRQ